MDTAQCTFEELARVADVVLVQEHWYFDCQLDRLNAACERFVGCGKAVDTGDPILPVQMPRGYGGTAILWQSNMDHLVTRLSDGGNRIQCIEVSSQDPLLLVSVYMPCRGLRENVDEFQDCLAQLREVIKKYASTHMIMVGGDFNEDLYGRRDSARLRSLKNLLEESQLTTQKTDRTYVNQDGVDTSTIDYLFYCGKVNRLSPHIDRLEEIYSNASDHYPVCCTFKFHISRVATSAVTLPLPSKVRWDKVDKDQYVTEVGSQLSRVKREFSSLGVLVNEISKLTDVLLAAATKSAPTVKKRRRKAKLAVWSSDVQKAVREKKEAFWKWKQCNRPIEADHYLLINKKLATSNLRKICRFETARAREKTRQEILDAKAEDSKLFHKLVNKQRGRLKHCVNELHVGGKVYYSSTGILDGWRDHFGSLAVPDATCGFDEDYREMVDLEIREIMDMCCDERSDGHERITVQQVKQAVSALNRGKAADVYGLTAEHFLHGGDGLLETTTDIINGLYKFGKLSSNLKVGVLTPVYKKKGVATEAKNYRGITILPTITKILETVLRQKIRPMVENQQNNLQRGFTQNSSPMNCSLILEEVIREHKDKRLPLYIAFLDAKSAFDVVSHNSSDEEIVSSRLRRS